MPETVRILGTHGVPAAYGGFETAAENVGLHLAAAGWRVVVYCQVEGRGPITEDTWRGLERVNIPVDVPGWRGTSKFDLLSIRHASRFSDPCLTFGYNTAIFNSLQRLKAIPLIVNMDGIEWSRSRWGRTRQAILYANERIACWLGNELIADHPEIETYLQRKADPKKITMIPYGADAVTGAAESLVRDFGLEPGRYLTLICRSIPENSILELVRAFSSRTRGYKLAVLGKYDAEDAYHRQVMSAASAEVSFLGSIYDRETLDALRFHSRMYLHGHTVGGTNPSLVEAMAAGNPVLARDNAYNRWVAGDGAVYFSTVEQAADQLDRVLSNTDQLAQMTAASRSRHAELFTWENIAAQYETLVSRQVARSATHRSRRNA